MKAVVSWKLIAYNFQLTTVKKESEVTNKCRMIKL